MSFKSYVFLVVTCWLALNAPASPTNSVDVSFLRLDVPRINPVGQRLTYSIALTNAGPATATRVVLTHPIPAPLTDPAATISQGIDTITNRLLRWEVGTLPAGGTAEISVEATPVAEGGVEIEVEVTTMDQLDEALAAEAEIVLLDNMSPVQVRDAIARIEGRATTRGRRRRGTSSRSIATRRSASARSAT